MGRINNKTKFEQDADVSLIDYLIGSNGGDGVTKTFSLESLLSLFSQNFEGSGLVYKYAEAGNILDETSAQMFTSDSDTVSSITTLNINKVALSGLDVSEFIDAVTTTIITTNFSIKLEKTSDINVFGYLDITSITDNTTHYTIVVTQLADASNGLLVDGDDYYMRFSPVVAGSGGGDTGFTDTTWVALVANGTREAGQKWNITDIRAGYTVAFGNVTLTSQDQFIWVDENGFQEIITIE